MAIANFVPEIWAANLLLPLRDNLIYGGAGVVNRDYEGEIARAGDTVHITNFLDPTVRKYTRDNPPQGTDASVSNITWEGLTDAQQTLLIDQADYFAFKVDDLDKRQAMPGFVAATTVGASYNLSHEADQYLSGLMADQAGNKLDALTALTADESGSNAYDNLLVPLRTVMARANAPATGRWCIVPPEVYALLLRDVRFTRSDSSPGQTVQTGLVGRAAGFDIYESNLTPSKAADATAGTPASNTVIAGHSMATTFAQQIASVEAVRLQDTFGDGVKGLHLYGARVIRPELLAAVDCTVTG